MIVKSGEALEVLDAPFAYVTVSEEGPGEQLLGMRLNGWPPSVPLTVSEVPVIRFPTVPRVDRSTFRTLEMAPLAFCLS